MTVPTKLVPVLFGVLITVGLIFSFQIAALLGALSVIGLAVWDRRRTVGQCPQCGAVVRGAGGVCGRCGYELSPR